MAVGDVVNSIGATSTYLNFQPAAGVECVITSALGSTSQFGLFDGTNFSGTFTASSELLVTVSNTKIFINNTYYFRFNTNAVGFRSYSGIQIK